MFITYDNMILCDSNDILLNDKIIICFFRWMNSQSSKITVIDFMVFNSHHLHDGKTNKIRTMITDFNLTTVSIFAYTYFFLFFHKKSREKFVLIHIYSLYSEIKLKELF